jgi:predicted regulator of Ras-like GTPase activity (Roadblock/LC7/MglB family)
MHWLETELDKLRQMAVADVGAAGPEGPPPVAGRGAELLPRRRERGQAFMAALRRLVLRTAERSGVTACFACHDGLVVEVAGHACDFEALSALTQVSVSAGHETAQALALGPVSQMLIVGEDHKLALILLGSVAIGILAPSTVDLASALG